MDIFDKLKDTITNTTKDVADKAKDVAGIASLKGQINAAETVIRKSYIEIGRCYYEQHGSDPDDACADACQVIAKAMAEIEELNEKINIIKGTTGAEEACEEACTEEATEEVVEDVETTDDTNTEG